MGVTLPNHVIGEIPLGQQGIIGNILALDIDGNCNRSYPENISA
jgi:hypothetical protein